MRFIDAGAPGAPADDVETETEEGSSRADSFASRYQPLLSWTSSLDLNNRQPLLCSSRDLRSDAPPGEYQVSLGVGATGALGLLLVGPGASLSAGLNIGVTSRGTAFVQIQGALGVGMGSYVGFGVQGGGSYASVPMESGFSGGTQIEGNIGLGPSIGASYQRSSNSDGGQVGIPKLPERYGEGYGMNLSVSRSGTATLAIPLPSIPATSYYMSPLLIP